MNKQNKKMKLREKFNLYMPQVIMSVIYMDVYVFLRESTHINRTIVNIVGIIFAIFIIFDIVQKILNEKSYKKIRTQIDEKIVNKEIITNEELERLLDCTQKRYGI